MLRAGYQIVPIGLVLLQSLSVDAQVIDRTVAFTPDESLRIELVRFQDFRPGSADRTIEVRDPMLRKFVQTETSATQLSLDTRNSSAAPKISGTANNMQIADRDELKAQIFAAVDDLIASDLSIRAILPNGRQSLDSLSIHDAVLLSGRIVTNRLDYYNEMTRTTVPDSARNQPFGEIIYSLGHDGEDIRSEEAKRIDGAYADQILSEGRGICRNYAPVNRVVFEFLKSGNRNLRNTHMTVFTPESLGHSITFAHAWNRVFTVSDTPTGQHLLLTYVDPTFLDTRIDEEGDIEAYNALDDGHFGPAHLMADRYLCDLVAALGRLNAEIFLRSEFRVSPEEARTLQRGASRCYLALSVKAAGTKGSHTLLTADAFLEASVHLTAERALPVSMALQETAIIKKNIVPRDMKQYRAAYRTLDSLMKDEIADPVLLVSWPRMNETTGEYDDASRKISIREIFTFVDDVYGRRD